MCRGGAKQLSPLPVHAALVQTMWLCGDFPRHLASEVAEELAPTNLLGVGKVAREPKPQLPSGFGLAALRACGVFLCAFWAQAGPHKSGLDLLPGDHLGGGGVRDQASKNLNRQLGFYLRMPAALHWPGPDKVAQQRRWPRMSRGPWRSGF